MLFRAGALLHNHSRPVLLQGILLFWLANRQRESMEECGQVFPRARQQAASGIDDFHPHSSACAPSATPPMLTAREAGKCSLAGFHCRKRKRESSSPRGWQLVLWRVAGESHLQIPHMPWDSVSLVWDHFALIPSYTANDLFILLCLFWYRDW